MKRTTTLITGIFTIAILGILTSSCEKKFDDALPKITLQSVTLHGLDSVLLTGQITTKGASDIEYAGFSFSSSPSFSILQNQILLQQSVTTFTAVAHAYHDTTYYFKAFAANSLGYNTSNTIKFTVGTPPPAIAPCTLSANQITDNGSSFSAYAYGSASNPQYGNYSVVINGNEDITMSFPAVPYNGIYTTTTDGSNLSAGQIIVTISNFNQYTINGGQKVYVSIDSVGNTTISACSLQYNIGSSLATMYGKVTY